MPLRTAEATATAIADKLARQSDLGVVLVFTDLVQPEPPQGEELTLGTCEAVVGYAKASPAELEHAADLILQLVVKAIAGRGCACRACVDRTARAQLARLSLAEAYVEPKEAH